MSAPAAIASSSSSRVVTSTSILSVCGAAFAGARDCLRHAVRATDRGEVVVLDQHAIGESEAVVVAAAVLDRQLFEQTHAGSGFPGVDHARDAALGFGDILARDRGHAGEPLHEVEGGALGREERAGRAADPGERRERLDALAVVDQGSKRMALSTRRKTNSGDPDARDDAGMLGEDRAFGAGRQRHGGERRDVAGADVLGEGEVDDGFPAAPLGCRSVWSIIAWSPGGYLDAICGPVTIPAPARSACGSRRRSCRP